MTRVKVSAVHAARCAEDHVSADNASASREFMSETRTRAEWSRADNTLCGVMHDTLAVTPWIREHNASALGACLIAPGPVRTAILRIGTAKLPDPDLNSGSIAPGRW